MPGQELRYKTSGAKNATRYYSHAGQTIAARTSTTLQWMSSDRHGTAELAIANSDQVVRARRMTPFGELRGDSSWLPFLDKGFVGGTVDNTGLTHLGAREYEPSTGRFVSVDPVMDLADAQQMHGYAYSNNNPVTFTDPSGLAYCDYNVCHGDPGYNPNGPQNNRDGKCVVNCHNRHDNYAPAGDVPAGAVSPARSNKSVDCSGYGYHVKDTCAVAQSYVPPPPMTTSEKWHLGLDTAGLFPVVGEPADLGSCGLYVYEGKGWDAALSCGSAVPIFGWIPAGIKMAKNGLKAGRHADEAAEALGKCVNSFSGDTLVLMADGTTKRIDEIKVGDKVANSEPESEQTEQHEVLAVHVTDADKDYIDLTIATPDGPKTITTTAHHPFYNATAHAWVDADTLVTGDELNTSGNGRTSVLSARHYTATLRTYNLTIDTIHTYYVLAGTIPVLVHNTGGCIPALRNWQSERFQFDNQQFLLDKKGMEHILTRHHPAHWDGSVKAQQSFFDRSMSVEDVQSAIGSVMRQNRDTLVQRGGRGMYQIRGSVNGVDYVLGVNNGRVGQFYPLPGK